MGGACSLGVCGDGFRELGPAPPREGCDDGNTAIGDACGIDCTPTVLVVSSRPLGVDAPGPVALAEDDTGALLFVWTAEFGSSLELRARRVSAAGVPVDAHDAPIVLDDTLDAGWDPQPVVVGLASGWVVAWAAPDGDGDEAGIRYRAIRSDRTLGTSRVANEQMLGRQHQPSIARLSSGFALAWTDESGVVTPPGQARVAFRTFSASGTPLSVETSLSDASHSAREPFLASDGSRVLAVWTRDALDAFGDPQIRGRRLGGASPDTSSFAVSAVDGAQPSAAVLASGDLGVAWVGRSDDHLGDIRARRVNRVGDPLTGTSVVTLTGTTMPHAELAPSVAGVVGDEMIVGYEDDGTRRGVAFVHAGTSALAPESADLAAHLTSGLQGDVTVLRTSRGLWFAWSDAGSLGHSDAYRSFLAYLLPID